jgi:hypothetical protein
MPLRRLIDTIAPAPHCLKAVQADARNKGLHKLTKREIQQIIADVRKTAAKETAGAVDDENCR